MAEIIKIWRPYFFCSSGLWGSWAPHKNIVEGELRPRSLHPTILYFLHYIWYFRYIVHARVRFAGESGSWTPLMKSWPSLEHVQKRVREGRFNPPGPDPSSEGSAKKWRSGGPDHGRNSHGTEETSPPNKNIWEDEIGFVSSPIIRTSSLSIINIKTLNFIIVKTSIALLKLIEKPE